MKRIIRVCAMLGIVAAVAGQASAKELSPTLDSAALEASGATIGEIRIERRNVFDLSLPEENNALYRLANRLHIMTREDVIRQQLLVATGDAYDERRIQESERLLRQNEFLYDATIRPQRYANGVVDLLVTTRDVWTLLPGLSVSRKGGENRTRVSIAEQNLFGSGARVKFSYIDDVDRESTGVEYADRNLGDSWTSLLLRYSDNSDGHFQYLALQQPFYSLDTRWSAGLQTQFSEAETRFYDRGNEIAEYRSDNRFASVFAGWSGGLQAGWVRRYTAGITLDERYFSVTEQQELPQLLPADRELLYPWFAVEVLEDRYETSSNRDQIERTEDFYLGQRYFARVGLARETAGSDRDAIMLAAAASRGFGDIDKAALLVNTSVTGRVESGDFVNARWNLDARYYRQLGDNQLFYTTVAGSLGRRLDLDAPLQLGGDNGLRGYPLRYQVGESRALLTLEYRYFTNWYPFRLARVGGAVFADAGRTWGSNPAGGSNLGWLRDVGFGLRLMPTRSGGREVIHFDIAFPLDGDASIDDVQILLESKTSF